MRVRGYTKTVALKLGDAEILGFEERFPWRRRDPSPIQVLVYWSRQGERTKVSSIAHLRALMQASGIAPQTLADLDLSQVARLASYLAGAGTLVRVDTIMSAILAERHGVLERYPTVKDGQLKVLCIGFGGYRNTTEQFTLVSVDLATLEVSLRLLERTSGS
jgi:hypothetical protein